MWTENFQIYKLDFKKAEEPEIKLPTSIVSQKKLENSKNKNLLCFIDYAKAFDCVDHTNCGKLSKEMRKPELMKNLYAGQEAIARMVMEQWTSSNWERKYIKGIYFRPAYLTSLQSTLFEMPGWMNHKLESRLLPGVISTTTDMQMIPL